MTPSCATKFLDDLLNDGVHRYLALCDWDEANVFYKETKTNFRFRYKENAVTERAYALAFLAVAYYEKAWEAVASSSSFENIEVLALRCIAYGDLLLDLEDPIGLDGLKEIVTEVVNRDIKTK